MTTLIQDSVSEHDPPGKDRPSQTRARLRLSPQLHRPLCTQDTSFCKSHSTAHSTVFVHSTKSRREQVHLCETLRCVSLPSWLCMPARLIPQIPQRQYSKQVSVINKVQAIHSPLHQAVTPLVHQGPHLCHTSSLSALHPCPSTSSAAFCRPQHPSRS